MKTTKRYSTQPLGCDRSCNSGVAGRWWRVHRQRSRAERTVVSDHDRSASNLGHTRPGERRFAGAVRVAGVAEVEGHWFGGDHSGTRDGCASRGHGRVVERDSGRIDGGGIHLDSPGRRDGSPPTTSNLNFSVNETAPNSVQVALPTTGANAGQDRHHLRRPRHGWSDHGCVDRCHGVPRRGQRPARWPSRPRAGRCRVHRDLTDRTPVGSSRAWSIDTSCAAGAWPGHGRPDALCADSPYARRWLYLCQFDVAVLRSPTPGRELLEHYWTSPTPGSGRTAAVEATCDPAPEPRVTRPRFRLARDIGTQVSSFVRASTVPAGAEDAGRPQRGPRRRRHCMSLGRAWS